MRSGNVLLRMLMFMAFASGTDSSLAAKWTSLGGIFRAAESEAGAPGQLMDTGPLLDTCTEHNFQNLKIVVDLFVGC